MAKFLVLLSFLAVAYASASSRTIHNAASPSRLPSEYLVSVKPNLVRGTLKQRMESFVSKMSSEISVVARYDFNRLSVLHIKSDSEAVVAQLYDFPEVSSVEANLFEQAIEQTCIDQTTVSGLWGLARISKRDDDNENTYSYQGNDGAGGFVYVVDSGIMSTHNDYSGRARTGFVAPGIPATPEDGNGHGTHCAGTVMSDTYGVAKAAGSIAVKVLNSFGSGSASGVIAGLEWILQDFQAQSDTYVGVASISLRFTPNDAMDLAIGELFDAGLPTTASAGNQASSSCNQSPARAEKSIAVMASDVNNNLATFSSYGACANIIGPGVSVLSTYNRGNDDTNSLSGTSMSCPHTAGVILRYMTQMVAETGSRPTSEEMRTWLFSNASQDQINIRGLPETPNLFLYAPCDLTP